MSEIGFMQGRLSPIKNSCIQSSPWDSWDHEFKLGHDSAFNRLEWTLDEERLFLNPLMTAEGRKKIQSLSKQYNIQVSSISGDCFMQAPFWKEKVLA